MLPREKPVPEEFKLLLLNKYRDHIPDNAVNIMRPTVFGNPFAIGKDGTREEVVQKYTVWLEAKIKRDPEFKRLVKALYKLPLVCCCTPNACHGVPLMRATNRLNGVR